jgi:hypothetical protein
VCYPWHPAYDVVVNVVRESTTRTGEMARVGGVAHLLVDEPRPPLRGRPRWSNRNVQRIQPCDRV